MREKKKKKIEIIFTVYLPTDVDVSTLSFSSGQFGPLIIHSLNLKGLLLLLLLLLAFGSNFKLGNVSSDLA